MEIQDIIISNKLIAKFMKYDNVDCYDCKYTRDCNWIQCGLTPQEKDEQLKYNSSWNWLMPVVEKIELLKDDYHGAFQVLIHSNSCSIQSINIFKSDKNDYYYNEYTLESKIESTYTAVVKFIEWYNKNK